jgi:hypothetical protein
VQRIARANFRCDFQHKIPFWAAWSEIVEDGDLVEDGHLVDGAELVRRDSNLGAFTSCVRDISGVRCPMRRHHDAAISVSYRHRSGHVL